MTFCKRATLRRPRESPTLPSRPLERHQATPSVVTMSTNRSPSNNDDDDNGAWPDEVFRKMKEGHDKFMRDLEQHANSDLRSPHSTVSEQTPPSPPQSNDRRGVFVGFKDLVDSTAASFNDLARNLSQFPANLTELRGKMQSERAQRREEEMDGWRRWTGHEASPDHVQMMMERASPADRHEALNAAMCLVQESARRNERVSAEKIKALFVEPSRTDPFGLFDVLDFDEANRWLGVEWFRRNAYSPVRLEAHPDACTQGTRWREAFEDLLSVSLGKPMVSHEQVGERPWGNVQSTLYGPGLDWMLSLQCRGVLPPQLPTFWAQLDARRSRGSLQEQIATYLLQKTQRSGNGIRQDSQFHDLVREIGTPAPEQSFDPRVTSCPVLGASAPESEQDLYDALYAHEQSSEHVTKHERLQHEDELVSGPQSFTHEQWRHDHEEGEGGDVQQVSSRRNGYQAAADPTTHDRVLALEQQAEALGFDRSVWSESTDVTSRAGTGDGGANGKVDVLSSLTTTHTTRLPDGTVTTKVMLKQRFADGREETQEKVHTYQESAGGVQHAEKSELREQAGKKGWFWS
nr:hypothetical protein CFP56_30060 [Quercus suber]